MYYHDFMQKFHRKFIKTDPIYSETGHLLYTYNNNRLHLVKTEQFAEYEREPQLEAGDMY